MEFYVYYRVKIAHAVALQKRVLEMQCALSADHGIAVALKRRPEVSDGLQTWMEIYSAVPADFEAMLNKAALEYGVAELIEGSRHVERFMDIGSCA